MKITGFNPMIITKDPVSVIVLFEELGFLPRHNKTGDEKLAFSTVRMKDANGFHVDVIEAESAPIQQDLTAIRINVDDFEEAYNLLLSKGFKESKSFGVNYTESSKYAFLVSPSGFLVDLIQHIRKEDR